MRILSLLATSILVVACGDGSGGSDISGSKKLTDLTPAEQAALCEDLSFERQVTCEGTTITIRSKNCTDLSPPPATCTATVSDARACFEAQTSATDAQLCSGELAGCESLLSCGDGGV